MSGLRSAVHVLGAGSMGSLLAHELVTAYPELQVTMLLKNKHRLNEFIYQNRQLTVVRQHDENIVTSKSQVLAETLPFGSRHIDNLIIATKTYATGPALEPFLPNLSENSNILFLQNGMGVTDSLTKTFWPKNNKRPNILHGISTHGAYKALKNEVHHVGLGGISIAKLPVGNSGTEIPEFIRLLTGIPALNAEVIPDKQFLLVQIEKLVINACINPTTTIYDCLNGDLLYGHKISTLFRKIISEAIPVLRKEYTVLLEIPEAGTWLGQDRLLNRVFEVCQMTAKNSSSMREDVKHGNITEIDSINGYIAQLGHVHRLGTPVNRLLVSMIKDKHRINQSVDQANTESIIIDDL